MQTQDLFAFHQCTMVISPLKNGKPFRSQTPSQKAIIKQLNKMNRPEGKTHLQDKCISPAPNHQKGIWYAIKRFFNRHSDSINACDKQQADPIGLLAIEELLQNLKIAMNEYSPQEAWDQFIHICDQSKALTQTLVEKLSQHPALKAYQRTSELF
jgi:hypothetical protein